MRHLALAEKFRSEMANRQHTESDLLKWFAENVGDTGLKDKNGRPIREGDSVRFYHKGGYVECTVVYDERNAAFLLRWPDGYLNQYFLNASAYEVITR